MEGRSTQQIKIKLKLKKNGGKSTSGQSSSDFKWAGHVLKLQKLHISHHIQSLAVDWGSETDKQVTT